jgi:hAT family C-terminal dimerisation region
MRIFQLHYSPQRYQPPQLLFVILNLQDGSTEKNACLATLKAHLHPTELHRATLTFLRYYTKHGAFADHDTSWEWVNHPIIFWQLHFDDNPALSKLADRILHTLANSVPCERNFSTMNFVHSLVRNRLTTERVDKLLYVQINRRTLHRDLTVKEEEQPITIEEEQEEPFGHIIKAPASSEDVTDVLMSSQDELHQG